MYKNIFHCSFVFDAFPFLITFFYNDEGISLTVEKWR